MFVIMIRLPLPTLAQGIILEGRSSLQDKRFGHPCLNSSVRRSRGPSTLCALAVDCDGENLHLSWDWGTWSLSVAVETAVLMPVPNFRPSGAPRPMHFARPTFHPLSPQVHTAVPPPGEGRYSGDVLQCPIAKCPVPLCAVVQREM